MTAHTRLAPLLWLCVLAAGACRTPPPTDRVRVSGQIEATDVRVSAPVAGRLLELQVAEGQRVTAGPLIAKLDTADAELGLARARADQAQADAQLRLLQAGARPEDIRQAEAQVATADADASAAASDLGAAEVDVQRFESLLASNSGSRKQRDDAVARRDVARDRRRAADQRVAAAQQAVRRLRAGARKEEIEGARARVTAAAAQVAIWDKAIADATITAPIAGTITETIADAGELVQPRAPLVVITDLDRAWANVYVDEPAVPRLRVGQTATLFPDGGGQGIRGTVSAISDKAEFTPRNVQTAEDRSKLVFRVKIAVDNQAGVLKAGMPVEAEIPLSVDAVTLDHVTKRYGQTEAVVDLSLSIAAGEMFGVIGPDGAGKTTAIRVICGLLKADRGAARVFGLDPVRDHRRLTASIGYLSQRFSLYTDLSIDENIAFFAEIHGLSDYSSRRDRLLALTGLTSFRGRLAGKLSGGMKQKLALVCTLIHEPKLIVLDEPTTGVDPVSRREFWKLLAEFLAQGITIVMATPYLDEAERCARVAFLHEGRLLALDTPAALRASLPGALFEVMVPEHRRIAAALAGGEGVISVQLFGERAHVRLQEGDTTEGAARIEQRLRDAGLGQAAVRPIPSSLEDVFVTKLGEMSS